MSEQIPKELSKDIEGVFGDWIRSISKDQVGPIDTSLVKAVLETHGADFEQGGDALQESKWKNRRPGMVAVWGERRVADYEVWVGKFVQEAPTQGRQLPIVGRSKRAGLGPLQFFPI